MYFDPARIRAVATESNFSGVLAVDVADETMFQEGFGFANRAYEVRNSPRTQFGIASGSKAFTALAIMRLIDAGKISLQTRVREVLDYAELPLIDDGVTIEHLLAHRSGIGDYLDETEEWDPSENSMEVPPHVLETAAAFIPLLAGRPQKFAPGERFAYCNAGFIVLAIIIERLTGLSFQTAVAENVFQPAALRDTYYPRMDDLPARAARGYVFEQENRLNTLYLPIIGNGDGGAFTTAADMHKFWTALFAGAIIAPESVQKMVHAYSDVPEENMRYGLGFWLHRIGDQVILEGCDSGVSFRSVHDPKEATTVTVLSNTAGGAWPLVAEVALLAS